MNLKNSKNRAGFTLIELIVVIAIMAILAGVAVPVYSGYIEKAEKAADLQLLDAVNSAFAASVVENGGDPHQLSNASAPITNGKISTVSASNASGDLAVQASFDRYFAGNETAQFKAITLLTFNYADGVFTEGNEVYAALLGKLDPDDVAALQSSAFGQIGLSNLLNKVDQASDLAAAMAGLNHDKVTALIMGDENLAKLASYLGYDDPTSEEFANTFIALQNQKIAALKSDPNYAGKSDEELAGIAAEQIMANNAVLVAATNTSFDTNTFKTELASGTAWATIQSNLTSTNGDTQAALSQAAFAYGMYTSYCASKGISVSEDIDMEAIRTTLATDEFQSYIANDAAADIAGYNAAMSMVNSSTSNSEAVSDVLLNGFNNNNLLSLLQSAAAQNK